MGKSITDLSSVTTVRLDLAKHVAADGIDVLLVELEQLRRSGTIPQASTPRAETTRLTREIGDLTATLARRLEKRGYSPTQTSGFLMRTLFTMFAEDIGLLSKDSFTVLLKRQMERPELLHHQLRGLCATLGDEPLHVVARPRVRMVCTGSRPLARARRLK
jgi:transposase